MEELIGYIVYFVFFLGLLGLGLFVGRAVENAHLKRLDAQERELASIIVSDLRFLPGNWRATNATIVGGEVVIATDYFKTFAAGLRKLIGGRMRSYETLLERARREAMVRMLRRAQAGGANVVWNVRFETMIIGSNRGTAGVAILVWGTAMHVA